MYTPETVDVHLFRDSAKTDHAALVKIEDLGTVVDLGRRIPSSDDMLGNMAKEQVVGQGRFGQEEADSFTVHVERPSASSKT